MTKIRTRLLAWLLPPLIAFIALISTFFYLNWYKEIQESFKDDLEAIVISVSKLVDPDAIKWIKENRDAETINNPIYKDLSQKLNDIRNSLPIASLYIVSIEEVKPGEAVFPDLPESEFNPVNQGDNPKFAYRQVYLIDSAGKNNFPVDFAESNEASVYNSRKPLITPIYQGLSTSENFMSGYAPILDQSGEVIALVGADLNLNLFERNLKRALLLIVLSGLLTIFLVIAASSFIAYKITQPVQKLKDAAMVLASGEYNDKIDIKGPKEIVELASTLNTMRECLIDNMSRLTNYQAAQNKLYGEYECAEMLQNEMLAKEAEKVDGPFKMKVLKLESSDPVGLKLNITPSNGLMLHIEEAKKPGFAGIYEMLNQPGIGPHLNLAISNEGKIKFESKGAPDPLLWSTRLNRFIPLTEPMQSGDFLLLINTGMNRQMPHAIALKDWFQKVLKHFSKEGLDLTQAMLESELNFLAKKQLNHEDIKIIIVHKS